MKSLGCGKGFKMYTSMGFICGVADAWGKEKLCPDCDLKQQKKWAKEDK